jgi:hypothetical protein
VVVQPRLLVMGPAEEPDVEMGVAVELNEGSLLRVVMDEKLPRCAPPRDLAGERPELGALEIAAARDGGEPRRLTHRPGSASRPGKLQLHATTTGCCTIAPKRRPPSLKGTDTGWTFPALSAARALSV